MAESWGGEFLCQKKRKYPHSGNFYFFDSKPESFACPWCQDGTLMKRVRVLDLGKLSGQRLAKMRRIGKLIDPAAQVQSERPQEG